MSSSNKFSLSYILERFNDGKSIRQIKNLKKQLKPFEYKDIDPDSNPDSNNQKEQQILSLISSNILEKINYFTNSTQNNFNYELFIYVLLELIIYKNYFFIIYFLNK